MKKNEMAMKTMEGFIRKLEKEGFPKYASELRSIVAMSRKRKDAIISLSGMTPTLLIHLIKYITMPHSMNKNKWYQEMKGYLAGFNTRNKSPKGHLWLSIGYIQDDLNDVLSSPDFLEHLNVELEGYPDKNKILNLLKTKKTLKSLGVKLFFDLNNRLNISIKGQIL